MPKKILITGCGGFVGLNLVRQLDIKKYRITCVSRKIDDKNAVSCYDKKSIKEAIKSSDVVIHLAAITNPFDRDIWKINVDYTRFLVGEAKKYNKRFVYISTQNVLFGKDNYSNTKRKAEDMVKTLKDFVILRPAVVYGKEGGRYIERLVKIVKNCPVVPIIGDGRNMLQPVYLGDLVKIIENCINSKVRGIFLVAGQSAVTYNELVDLIIKKLKVKRLKIHVPVFIIKPFPHKNS